MTSSPVQPKFSLVDHEGRAIQESDLHGTYSLVFFGFTNCAVVCPRALNRLQDVLKGLGSAAGKVRVYYVSVDPQRDTPSVMKSFLDKSYPGFTGLTGSTEQVDSARKEFRVFAKAKQDANALGGYVVPHTAFTYLLNLNGFVVDHFNDVVDANAVTARVLDQITSESEVPVNGVGHDQSGQGQESLQQLDPKSVASIRHIGNLARQLKGDWSNMMGPADLNDGFGAYRYQIAFMFYALTLAHYHRLPAAPGYFKDTMERMIQKMLEPDVWFYWHDASVGGGHMQTPKRDMIYDPIKTDNIMYSAYLQTMTAMYHSLFDDNRYQKPGALTFEYDTFLWGPKDGFKFIYDQKSINDQVYWNMVEEGYLGVACEPWCIYQICNQIPIHGFRLNDAIAGDTNIAEEVTQGYVKAWEEAGGGILTPEGVFNTFYMKHTNQAVVVPGGSGEAWCGMLMNAWNNDLVKKTYENRLGSLISHREDGSLSVNIPNIQSMPTNQMRIASGGIWGWIAAWAAEMGDDETKDRLLEYADKHFNPRLQNGGLMYPRNDTFYDKNGDFVMVSPVLSNSIIPLTRLNVSNGLKRFYENPWGARNRAHYDEPALVEVDFNVDVYRAVYIASTKTLLFDLAVFEEGAQGSVTLGRIFGRGNWTLKRDGQAIAHGSNDTFAESDHRNPIQRGVQGISSSLGLGFVSKPKLQTLSALKQDGELLRLPVIGTKVASYVLQWDNESRCHL
ncbi:hypothetical protein BDV18DRAFT_874 [Aspergillus unguis]